MPFRRMGSVVLKSDDLLPQTWRKLILKTWIKYRPKHLRNASTLDRERHFKSFHTVLQKRRYLYFICL